jgi:hypothetical protein
MRRRARSVSAGSLSCEGRSGLMADLRDSERSPERGRGGRCRRAVAAEGRRRLG